MFLGLRAMSYTDQRQIQKYGVQDEEVQSGGPQWGFGGCAPEFFKSTVVWLRCNFSTFMQLSLKTFL